MIRFEKLSGSPLLDVRFKGDGDSEDIEKSKQHLKAFWFLYDSKNHEILKDPQTGEIVLFKPVDQELGIESFRMKTELTLQSKSQEILLAYQVLLERLLQMQ